MYKWPKKTFQIILLPLTMAFCVNIQVQAQDKKPWDSIGRKATTEEVKAWDIDVRPDFKGLPQGSGTVAKGQDVWEAKCASCHGTFAESNEVFTPIVGGTSAQDIQTGQVEALRDRKHPQRTTFMKVATVSTLFDYIYRAMPWNAPRSLTVDETYSVLNFLLNLAEIVPENFVLDQNTIVEVQNKMPNRNGMTLSHGLWKLNGQPDVKNIACMSNCLPVVKVESSLPDYARNVQGNLLEQNRTFGPFRGVDTTKPPEKMIPTSSSNATTSLVKVSAPSAQDLFTKSNCSACHAMSNKIVGPAVKDIANKYRGQEKIQEQLSKKVKSGGVGVWGDIPMPPHPNLQDTDIVKIVEWILSN